MLLILSAVDGAVDKREEKIIRTYMQENFSDELNFDDEKTDFENIDPQDYAVKFNDSMNTFYILSSQADRNHFLDMATRLVIADKEISPRENLYLKELYYAWEEETEE